MPISNVLTVSPIYSDYATVFGNVVMGGTYSNTRIRTLRRLAIAAISTMPRSACNTCSRLSDRWAPATIFSTAMQSRKHRRCEIQRAGLNHAFSKQTDVYGSAAWQTVSGDDSTGHAAVANIADLSPSSNRHQAVAHLGRHKFQLSGQKSGARSVQRSNVIGDPTDQAVLSGRCLRRGLRQGAALAFADRESGRQRVRDVRMFLQ
jgi:hypothetical protein